MRMRYQPLRTVPWMATAIVAAISGCSGPDDIPDRPGMYAMEKGELKRLDGNREWERETWNWRSNLSPNVSFVIRDQQLENPTTDVQRAVDLHRVGWVRSEIGPNGEILPVEGVQWVDADIDELSVPLQKQLHPESREVALAVPHQELGKGLYTLRMQGQEQSASVRVGIGWPALDKRSYASANCVDRYLNSDTPYRPCSDQGTGIATNALKVHLVPPEIRSRPGYSKRLIVKGVVINTSAVPHDVPRLKAEIVTEQGAVLRRWEFDVASTTLNPGDSVPFQSELHDPPSGGTSVHVTF